MKKILFLFLLFSFLSAGAIFVDDSNSVGMCGAYKYDNIYASFVPFSYACQSGEYLPADTLGCEPCPAGWDCPGGTYEFNSTKFQGLVKNATYMMGNENNVCAANYGHRIYGIFTPNQYTCLSGQFLPADALACVACPVGYECPGGTYVYDSKKSKGLTHVTGLHTVNETNTCSANFGHSLVAEFVPNSYTCASGYYLPADAIECAVCLAGNACAGGTYTFNENTDQGIQSCADVDVPAGFAICAPHRLHVGDDVVYMKSTRQTTPSLNVKIGNDIFYINMSSTRTKMNKDSAHYFRARWENNDYYICDDTTCPQ